MSFLKKFSINLVGLVILFALVLVTLTVFSGLYTLVHYLVQDPTWASVVFYSLCGFGLALIMTITEPKDPT